MLYKIKFNQRIIFSLEYYYFISKEILNIRKAILLVAINKELIANTSNQMKYLQIIISTDATNYYNTVSYYFATFV